VQRLIHRRCCASCGALYHLLFSPPRIKDVCDKCGGALIQRSDDAESTVRERLRVYEAQTAPLITFYGQEVHTVDCSGTPDEVFARIQRAKLLA
jgi:adenylate kinase